MSELPPPPTPVTDPLATPTAPSGVTHGRGCVGCLVSGGFGCSAFLIGAVAAIALFAPRLLGGWATRYAESRLESAFDGDVALGDLALSWREDQKASDVVFTTAAGVSLARATVRVPSLAELLEHGMADRIHARLYGARVSIDETGVSDLARFLRIDDARVDDRRDLSTWLRRLAARDDDETGVVPLDWRIESQVVEVDDARRTGDALRLEDLAISLRRSEEAGLTLSVEADVRDGDAPPGRFELSLTSADAAALRPSDVNLTLHCVALPSSALETLFGLVAAERWTQGALDVHLDVLGDVQAGASVDMTASAPAGNATFRGRLERGTLVAVEATGGLEFALRLPDDAVQRAVASILPDALMLRGVGPGGRWTGSTSGLRAPLGLDRGWELDVDRLRDETDLTLDAAASAAYVLAGRNPGEEYSITTPIVSVRLLGPLGSTVKIAALTPEGTFASVTMTEPGESLPGVTDSSGRVDIDLPSLPVSLFDLCTDLPEGLEAVFGQRIRLLLEGSRTGTPGATTFRLYPEGEERPIVGRVEDGVVYTARGVRHSIRVAADDATYASFLLPILPWFEAIGAQDRVGLRVDFSDLELPLQSGPPHPVGALRIRPGRIGTRLVAGLGSRLGVEADTLDDTWQPETWLLDLEEGLVRYASVEIPLAGTTCRFEGIFDRQSETLNLSGQIPATLVQDQIRLDPELAELLLDSEAMIEVAVNGSPESPSILIDTRALREMLSGDLQEALVGSLPALRGILDRVVGDEAPATSDGD